MTTMIANKLHNHALMPYVPVQQFGQTPPNKQYQSDALMKYAAPEILCRFIIDESPIPQIFYHAKDGVLITANPSLRKLLGYSIEDLANKKVIDLLHPEDHRFERELLFNDVRNKVTGTHSVKRCLTKNGDMRWCIFSSRGLVNEHGKVLFVMSTIQDISEYKQSETDTMQIISHFEYRIAEFINEIEHLQSQMQFSEEYKQKFIETASHEFRTPLSIIQTNCEIIQRYGSDVLGSEAITRRFQTIYKSVRQLTDLLDSSLGIDRVIRRENNDTSGLPLPSSNTGHPMFSDQKELRTSIISPSIVVKTETTTNTVRQEKQERNDQLLHLPEENTKILMHDLQNPLASIMLTSSSLERNWNKMPLPDFMKSLQSIGHHGRRMKEMIVRFLDTVSLEDLSSREKSFQNIELIHLIQTVITEYRIRADEKDIKINLNFNPKLITILADHNYMVQIMENLLSNAIKFSSNNSVIDVRIKVYFEGDTPKAHIEIEDEGQGIKEEEIGRLFTKFGRLSARPTNGEHSTGLGLWIVKQLVESMNGRVSCNSTWSQGTTFTITFPLVV